MPNKEILLDIRQVFRYSRPYSSTKAIIDDTPNHFYYTQFPNHSMVLLEKGINRIGLTRGKNDPRIPAIIIRSSPHKTGSGTTPWQDIFDSDNGYIRYYGDNKSPGVDPGIAPGNKDLLAAYQTYNDPDKREHSIPLVFYRAVRKNNQAKGYVEFNGFGIITAVELVTQFDRSENRTFSNFAFNFQIFSLADEHETFDWRWINARRDSTLNLKDTLQYAPKSWLNWIKHGNQVLEKSRRSVSKLLVQHRDSQIPTKGSQEEKALNTIYKYYHLQKARFEGLASVVTAKIIDDQVHHYKEGWITQAGPDGGADFYGRIEVGVGFGKAKLIVLGQAKCENLQTPTNGNHIARTVARLRRGWMGVYVTTSYFSEAVQREVIEDKYPILLINGLKLAETVLKILHDDGHKSLTEFLDFLKEKYESRVQFRRPEELFYE